MAEPKNDEQQVRALALKRIKKRRDFYWHLVTYVIINGFLTVVWAIGSRSGFWPMWVMIPWGIGLAFHAWDALGAQDATEADVQREIRRMKGPGPGSGR